MPLLRIIRGRADAPPEVKDKIRYLADPLKNVWQDESFVGLPGRLKGYMLPDDFDCDAIFYAFMAPHWAYGDVRSGHRLFYHFLMDFGGLLSPEQAVELGWQIAMWFQRFDVQYLQGLHCVKSIGNSVTGPVFQPHVHWMVSTRMLDGSGKKLHIGKPELKAMKTYANRVLAAHRLPLIVMKGNNTNECKIGGSGDLSCDSDKRS